MDEDTVSSRAQSQSVSAKGAHSPSEMSENSQRMDAEKPTADDEESPKNAEVDEDDLFGEANEDSPKRRTLDDEELDSGDDEGRDDRMDEDGAPEMEADIEEEQFNYMDAELIRHAVPCPSDNELYLLKVPRFLSIEPLEWHHEKFQPPVTDHHSKTEPSPTFSAFNTAMTTLRWRRSPSNPKELQSNARILRWSDGSLTLQFATDPTTQYDIDGNPLAPPQRNPPKPTPTSVVDRKNRAAANGAAYNPGQDTFTYLAAPSESAALLRLTNKITAGLSVVPSADSTDDALERLQNSLAAAVRGKNLNADGGIALVDINEDPELAKKKAEVAEKEKERAQKRREAQEMRERDRANRFLGRSGLRAGGYEIDDMGAGAGAVGAGAGGKSVRSGVRKPRRPRRDDYSDEEDYRRGKTREDEYDEEDEFIAKSDEEIVEEEDDEEEEEEEEEVVEAGKEDADADADGDTDADGDVEDDNEGNDTAVNADGDTRKGIADASSGSPKRSRISEDAADDQDEDAAPAVARTKRRRVVDEDDEEE